jgi:predicted MFS family arabinose efflux permease
MANLKRRFAMMAALSLGPLVATSFARFAYALLLPAMRADLGLSYSQAGLLNTANALGYLAGSLFVARCVSRFGNRRLFCAGMAITVAALIASGLTGDFIAQLGLRAIAGVSGAMVFICGAILASHLFQDRPALSSTAIAVYFGGAGAGIVLSGTFIPWLLATMGEAGWRSAWLAIGAASTVFAVFSIRAARRIDEPATGSGKSAWPIRAFHAALTSYFMFGIGYIAYMTFVIAWMVSHGASNAAIALTWGTLGVATMIAPMAWRVPRTRWQAGTMLAVAGLVISLGAAVPLWSTSLPAMILSAFLFGIAMFSIPAAITDLVKTSLPKAAWGSALAIFTVLFAVGQTIGPVLTGWLADATRSLNAGLAGSAAMLLAGSVVAMFQREIKPARISSPQRVSA